ncbi:MAG TPA: AMP-binding protein [Candidatus Melainabacteria bacterium]|nr:AMP-binding protein [Candidatus Melainabacteria bacterium]
MQVKLRHHQENCITTLPSHWLSLPKAFVHQARRQPHALAVCDSLGTKLTYHQLLLKSIALANILSKSLNSTMCVGIMLPPSAAAVIANLAVSFLGKIPVNLNYTAGQKAFDLYLDLCEIKHIISAAPFLKRVQIETRADLIYIESKEDDAGMLIKLKSWTETELIPEGVLGEFLYGLSNNHRLDVSKFGLPHREEDSKSKLNDPATIIFTAGSTSDPKGVVLSHRNILSNISAIKEQGQIKDGEIVLGVIPFFHSFGLTMTLWAPLCLGETVVYHYDPFDARRIGELCESHKATCLICTPTMLGLYSRRCRAAQFKSIRVCVVGGEKLKEAQSKQIESAFGIVPLQGYGLAETSPVVSCNVPNHVTLADGRIIEGNKSGTVGLPIPGTAIKITHADTGAVLPAGQSGIINVHGPQVMLGYLKQAGATAKAIKDGWFNTGDIGFLDSDGFLTVTGRTSQFSKIAGEMVSHMAVEEELYRVSGAAAGELTIASVPDDRRGERLVVIYSRMDKEPEQVVDELKKGDLPNLWIPNASDFFKIDALPVMPNGKLNLRQIKQIALTCVNPTCQA